MLLAAPQMYGANVELRLHGGRGELCEHAARVDLGCVWRCLVVSGAKTYTKSGGSVAEPPTRPVVAGWRRRGMTTVDGDRRPMGSSRILRGLSLSVLQPCLTVSHSAAGL